jgi:signal transduction histidine kinase
MYARRIAAALGDNYARTGSWQNVTVSLSSYATMNGGRIVLANASGIIIADTADELVGRQVAHTGLSAATPISVDGRRVGDLYIISEANGGSLAARVGGMMGMGRTARRSETGVSAPSTSTAVTPEQHYLDEVNRGLAFGAAGATILAVALSLYLTRRIVSPLNLLAAGARRIEAGNLGHHVTITSRDELGEVAQAFNTMSASLQRNEQARRNLLADIAHELRTPLTVIEGTASGIMDGVLEPSSEQLLIIKEEAELLAKLVGDLRELSLAEAGQLALERRPEDLGDVIGRAVRHFEANARERGVALDLAIADGVSAAPVDAGRITQAVGNILANAMRYTPPGGRIDVSVGPDPASPGNALIAVADTGEGLAAADLPKIFDRFYRADKSRSRRSGGSGLGLAIAKQIVEGHNGRIWVESELGQGAVFSISLPLC